MNIALLIDADNASPGTIGVIIEKVSSHGRITIKRAYGDFIKNCCLNPWVDKLKQHSVEVKQNFNHSAGKNSTDIAMVIDAMDILSQNKVDGFCLVSSDSDFTHLACRIRNQGMFCMGIGQFKTLPAFRDACDEFIYVENLIRTEDMQAEQDIIKTETPTLRGLNVLGKIDLDAINHKSESKSNTNPKIGEIGDAEKSILKQAYENVCGASGYALLSKVAEHIKRQNPDFDIKTYGYKSFSQLFSSLNDLYSLSLAKDGMTYTVFSVHFSTNGEISVSQ